MSNYGKHHSEETKRKISLALKRKWKDIEYKKRIRLKMRLSHLGKHHSEETKRKIGLSNLGERNGMYKSGKNNPMYGKHHSEETKRKISLSKKGYKYSKEVKKNYGKGAKKRWADPEYKQNQIKSIREKVIPQLRGRKGKKHTKETKEKMRKALKKRWTNLEYRKKMSLKVKERWKNPEYKKKMSKKFSEARIKNWKDPKYVDKILKSFKFKPNKPEKFLIKLMKENNLPFNYVGDGAIWFRGINHSFNPDFISKNPKHIIELFGDYWHNLPDYKKRDIKRLNTYSKYGYKTLIIWEHELREPNKVINKIKEFISEKALVSEV